MEINKNLLVCSIGTAIVVIAGEVYAVTREMKKIKDSLEIARNTSYACDLVLADHIDSLSNRVDSFEKSNKK